MIPWLYHVWLRISFSHFLAMGQILSFTTWSVVVSITCWPIETLGTGIETFPGERPTFPKSPCTDFRFSPLGLSVVLWPYCLFPKSNVAPASPSSAPSWTLSRGIYSRSLCPGWPNPPPYPSLWDARSVWSSPLAYSWSSHYRVSSAISIVCLRHQQLSHHHSAEHLCEWRGIFWSQRQMRWLLYREVFWPGSQSHRLSVSLGA